MHRRAFGAPVALLPPRGNDTLPCSHVSVEILALSPDRPHVCLESLNLR